MHIDNAETELRSERMAIARLKLNTAGRTGSKESRNGSKESSSCSEFGEPWPTPTQPESHNTNTTHIS